MTTETRPATAMVTSYTPTWALYVYEDRAFLTFDGKLVATALCATSIQVARLITLRDRLNARLACRVALTVTRAPTKRKIVAGRWHGRIVRYPGAVRFWYEVRERRSTRHTSRV